MKITFLMLGILVLIIIAVVIGMYTQQPQEQVPNPSPESSQPSNNPLPPASKTNTEPIQIIAEDLEIPWEIVFLPSGEMLVTERPGRIVKIGQDKTIIPIAGVEHRGEGGLLGLALHPNFASNHFIYLYHTTSHNGALINQVERYRLQGTVVTDRTVILDNIPGSSLHDGGRIAFGPDGFLYITTGDAGNENHAQNRDSLAGKIIRIKDDGSIPTDNPFQTAVYSYGHRNPQGLAWDESGKLWATEHGRSGLQSGFDEVNLIEPGTNYGWPTIQGDRNAPGLKAPIINSGATTTWAPSGAAVFQNKLFFAGLRGEALYQTNISDTTLSPVTTHLVKQYGRLRTVVVGPDGFLYVATNNRDGRGSPKKGDDKILKIDPQQLPR